MNTVLRQNSVNCTTKTQWKKKKRWIKDKKMNETRLGKEEEGERGKRQSEKRRRKNLYVKAHFYLNFNIEWLIQILLFIYSFLCNINDRRAQYMILLIFLLERIGHTRALSQAFLILLNECKWWLSSPLYYVYIICIILFYFWWCFISHSFPDSDVTPAKQ